jgi:hypothetical protein
MLRPFWRMAIYCDAVRFTAIPRLCAGGLKPEIVARVWETRPGCYRAIVVKDRQHRPSTTVL